MRKTLLILTALISFSIPALTSNPPKGTNTIYLIPDSDSPAAVYDGVMRALISEDVNIISTNADYHIIKASGAPTISGTSVTCNIAILEMDDRAVIRVSGTYASPIDDFRSEEKVTRRGMSGSIAMQAWESMLSIAMILPHTSVEFETK